MAHGMMTCDGAGWSGVRACGRAESVCTAAVCTAGRAHLCGDEAVEEHAHAEEEADLVEHGRGADHQRDEGGEHDEARHADRVPRRLERTHHRLPG